MKFQIELQFNDAEIRFNSLNNNMVAMTSAKAISNYWMALGITPKVILDIDDLPEEIES